MKPKKKSVSIDRLCFYLMVRLGTNIATYKVIKKDNYNNTTTISFSRSRNQDSLHCSEIKKILRLAIV